MAPAVKGFIMTRSRYLIYALVSVLILSMTVHAAINLSDAIIQKFEQKYGSEAAENVRQWRDLLEVSKGLGEKEKLIAVNNFFNRKIKFTDDILHWQKEDYWATPFEFIGTGAGDCEDFSIAKYFSLLELGVSDDKLRMTYVKALTFNQAHMVVTYFSEPGTVPLVLDNINPAIELATKRKDLLPVYSFNGAGLWLAKERGLGKRAGSSGRISLWTDLNKKMVEGL
jgi:predicted transglutaminase-like cysteine proteinase